MHRLVPRPRPPRRSAARAVFLAIACGSAGGCLPGLDGFVVVAGGDAGPAADGWVAPPDAGEATTALDRVCRTPWTDLPATPSGDCAGRSIAPIADRLSWPNLAIARAEDGTLTIVYDEREHPDYGSLATRLVHENALSEVREGPPLLPESSIGEVLGIDLAIATSFPDTHHIVYWSRGDSGHSVSHATLRGEELADPETIAVGVSATGVVDVEVDSEGRVVAAWHDDETGLSRIRRQLEGGEWSEPAPLRMDADPNAPGPGAIALAAGPDGTMHVAHQWSSSTAATGPLYALGVLDDWGVPRPVDNELQTNRLSGVSVDLAVVDGEAILAYLDWSLGVGEIRLARFAYPDGTIDATTIHRDIRLERAPVAHPIVLRADGLGRLHLLVANGVDSTSGAMSTDLLYLRQTRRAGALQWITDSIARLDVAPSEVTTAMIIGPDRRPHILYWDPAGAAVLYATVLPEAT
jgi:hypothetical protein